MMATRHSTVGAALAAGILLTVGAGSSALAGGYGYHGYGYGFRGYGYGFRGYYGYGYGFAPLALGLYFTALPLYYTTLYYGGIPYYYAQGTYYTYDAAASAYVTVAPPPVPVTENYAYPKNGQSTDQQAKDREECHGFAVSQTGFDPRQSPPAASAAPAKTKSQPMASSTAQRDSYLRAEAACLEARGYSVK